jgi:TatD DNase family protein
MFLYDSHNHLQEPVFTNRLASILADTRKEGVRVMVANGSSEQDWEAVDLLSRQVPEIIPAFGYHPWYIRQRTSQWQGTLLHRLEDPKSVIGEIGLDRWVKNYDFEDQQAVFIWQLRLASERNLPASIHCLQAWGKLLEILSREPRLTRGFLLHSYGGPAEMIEPLAELGAYFSLPGYFGHPRKEKQREAFRQVPADRLLIETDAPDQLPPDNWRRYQLEDDQGKAVNHPANLFSVYALAAEIRGQSLEDLAKSVEQNFLRLFGDSRCETAHEIS